MISPMTVGCPSAAHSARLRTKRTFPLQHVQCNGARADEHRAAAAARTFEYEPNEATDQHDDCVARALVSMVSENPRAALRPLTGDIQEELRAHLLHVESRRLGGRVTRRRRRRRGEHESRAHHQRGAHRREAQHGAAAQHGARRGAAPPAQCAAALEQPRYARRAVFGPSKARFAAADLAPKMRTGAWRAARTAPPATAADGLPALLLRPAHLSVHSRLRHT